MGIYIRNHEKLIIWTSKVSNMEKLSPKYLIILYIFQILEGFAFIGLNITFFIYNASGMGNLWLVLLLSQPLVAFMSGIIIFLPLRSMIFMFKNEPDKDLIRWKFLQKLQKLPAMIIFNLSFAVILIFLFMRMVLTNYYQPVSLYNWVIIFLAVTFVLLIFILIGSSIGYQVQLWTKNRAEKRKEIPQAIMVSVILWLLFFPVYFSVGLINQPKFAEGITHIDLFQRNEGGYYTHRIPSLVVIPAGSILNNSETVSEDIILAFTEARQNSALDNGAIDTVMKRSPDGGNTWSDIILINQWSSFKDEVKFGNPTAVFDNFTGKVILTYTNSTLENGEYPLFYRLSDDGGLNWSESIPLNSTVKGILGPGHGIQMKNETYAGRLIIPTYNSGGSFVMYSDDHGENWNAGGSTGYGGECEVVELDNGTLHMVLRTKVKLGTNHPPQHVLYALSNDGGLTWSEILEHPEIPTPIVMGSVAGTENGTIISFPDSYYSRVKMTIYLSDDDTESWDYKKTVYYGPSGYSQLATLSDGSIICMFEYGRVQYSDKIAFVKCSVDWLTNT